MLLFILFSAILFKKNGIFKQRRIGLHMRTFNIYKIRSYNKEESFLNGYGVFLRKYKLNELPQFFNVIKGDMSIVGPRPDTEEFKEILTKKEQEIMYSLKPGVTGPASIYFVNEELMYKGLEKQIRDRKITREKINFNERYIENYNLSMDVKYVLITVATVLKSFFVR